MVKKASPAKVAAKPVAHVSKKSGNVSINKNILLLLVLTLVIAAVALVVQAQSNNTNNEQNKAAQALDNESGTNKAMYKKK